MGDETFELYSLTSKLTLDASQFDRVYSESRRKFKVLAGDLKHVEGSAKTTGKSISSDLGGAVTRVLPGLSGLGAAGPAGLAAAGIALIGGTAIGTATHLVNLTLRVAEQIDSLGDLSDKINFSVRTLSGMGMAIEGAGGDLEGFGSALGIFDKNIEKAAQGDERLSTLFKALSIDATNNEQAFRQVAKVIFDLGGTSQQTALAMELFGKSGKEMVGIIKAAGGDVEEFIRQAELMGFVIGDDAVKAADKLDKSMILVRAQIDAATRQFATELMPMIQTGVTNFSKWMKENRGEIGKTITDLVNLIKTIGKLAAYIEYLSPAIFIVKTVYQVSKLLPEQTSGAEQLKQYERNLYTIDPNTGRRIYQGKAPFDIGGEFAVAGGTGGAPGVKGVTSIGAGAPPGKRDKTEQEKLADMVRELLSKDGGRKGGGAAKREPGLELLAQLEQQYSDLTEKTEAQRIAEKLLGDEFKNTSPLVRENILATALAIDTKKKVNEAEKQQADDLKAATQAYMDFTTEQARALHGSVTMMDEIDLLNLKLIGLGMTLTAGELFWLRFRAAEIQVKKTTENLAEILSRLPFADLAEVPDTIGRVLSDAQIDAMGKLPNADPLSKWRDAADDLAYDITYTIDNAIREGFEEGVGAGIAEFSLGILEMIRSEVLKDLQRAIAKAIRGGSSGDEEGEGGGSFFSSLLSFGIKALGSLFGGGGSAPGGLGSAAGAAIGGHAGGGFMYPGEWSIVGERGPELAKAGSRGASVMSNAEAMGMFGGGLTVYQSINVPSMYMAGNRETQTQAFRSLQQAAQRGYTLRG